jgi:hypothetical protein
LWLGEKAREGRKEGRKEGREMGDFNIVRISSKLLVWMTK